jgi:hypothetical protein
MEVEVCGSYVSWIASWTTQEQAAEDRQLMVKQKDGLGRAVRFCDEILFDRFVTAVLFVRIEQHGIISHC